MTVEQTITESMVETSEIRDTAPDSPKTSFLVSIIEAGRNKSGNRIYPEHVLRQAAPLFENARIFIDHKNLKEGLQASSRPEKRSFNDLAGVIKNVYFDQGSQRLQSEAVFLKDWVSNIARNHSDLVRLSINADVRAKKSRIDGEWVTVAQEILKVNSVDIVTVDGAGGKIIKVLESYKSEDFEMADEDKKNKDEGNEETTLTLESLQEDHPELVKELETTLTESITESVTKQLTEKFEEDFNKKLEEAKSGLTEDEVIEKALESALAEQKEALTAAHKAEIATLLESKTHEEKLNELLESAKLPEKSAEAIRNQFKGVTFEAVEESDGTEASSSIEVLENAVVDAIKAKRVELKEAGVDKSIHGLGESTSGEDKKIAKPVNDSIDKRMAI